MFREHVLLGNQISPYMGKLYQNNTFTLITKRTLLLYKGFNSKDKISNINCNSNEFHCDT